METFALGSLIGIVISLLCLIAVGLIIGRLPLAAKIVVPLLLALALATKPLDTASPRSPLPEQGAPWIYLTPLVALLLAAVPLSLVGSAFDGDFHFRAYFNADFFKHIANTEELARGLVPPVNPFAADRVLSYYWAAYLLPATAVQLSGSSVAGADALLAVGVIQTAVFGILAFVTCRRFSSNARVAAIAATLAMLSLSLDGITSLITAAAPAPIRIMQSINQEGLDFATLLGAPSQLWGSTWQRLCLYLPQHQLALMIFLAWIALFLTGRSHSRDSTWPARAAALLVLPLVSVPVGLIGAATITIAESMRGADPKTRLGWLVLLCCAAGLLLLTQIVSPAFGRNLADPFLAMAMPDAPLAARLAWFVPQLTTTFGVCLPLAIAGAWRHMKLHSWQASTTIALWTTIMVGVGIILLAELLAPGRLRTEIELKASFVLAAGLMFGTAALFSRPPELDGKWRAFRIACVTLLVLGLASPIHDLVWHSSFPPRYETVVPKADMQALRWIRAHTPAEAVFQQPLDRPYLLGGQDCWVAVFGARRVALAGRAASADPSRNAAVETIFDATSGRTARARAMQALRVDFIYLSKALLPFTFDALASALEDEGWAMAYRTTEVLIIVRDQRGLRRA